MKVKSKRFGELIEVVRVTYEDGHIDYLSEATLFATDPEKIASRIVVKKAERIEIMERVDIDSDLIGEKK